MNLKTLRTEDLAGGGRGGYEGIFNIRVRKVLALGKTIKHLCTLPRCC